jgi:two-component system phosphate regulon response regulator PhoB
VDDPRAADVVLVGLDLSLAAGLVPALARQGLEAAFEPCATDADTVHLVGGPDGPALCAARRRAGPNCRIVVVAEPNGAIAALEAGADDVVRREGLSVRELALRLRAVRRRSATVRPDPLESPLRVGPLVLGPDEGRVELDGRPLFVPPSEYRALRVLAQRNGKVIDRRTLMGLAWGDVELEARTVDSIVKRLRIRLGIAGELIETVRGVGYRFAARPPG